MIPKMGASSSADAIDGNMKVSDVLERLCKANAPLLVQLNGEAVGEVSSESVIAKLANSNNQT
jgi:sulfur carrier protein ThiS